MGRRTATLAVAALGLLAAGCAGGGGPAADAGSPAPEVAVELTATAQPDARCAVPSARALEAMDVAFEGVVSGLREGRATLEVERWFRGGPGESVVVASPDRDLQQLLLAVRFEEGTTYLVSAQDGSVSLCGLSGESTPELVALYEEAFGPGPSADE